jgi:trigger factor
MNIAAEEAEFSAALERTYRKVTREVAIPGFRRGKAPRQIVEQMIGRDYLVEEAGREMMDDLYRQALEDENIQPISEPDVEVVAPEPLEFKVVIEVFPSVTLGDYSSVRAEPREVALDDGELDESIESVRRNYAEWVDAGTDRTPRDGDQVTLDLEIFEGDEPFQEPATDAVFVLGESGLFEGLAEAIKLMTPGTVSEITLAFDEDDVSVRPELRDKTLRYQISLKSVQQRNLPELDDEFVDKVGRYPDVDTFKRAIERDAIYGKAQAARTELLNEVVEAIVATSEVDVPKTMVQSEIEDEITQLRTRLAQQGVSLEDYLVAQSQSLDELRAELAETAEQRIRTTLVLGEVAKLENLEVTDEDIAAEIDRLAEGAADADRMRQIYSSDYFRNMLQSELSDRKMTARMLEIATEGKGALSGDAATILEEGPELPEMRERLAALTAEEAAAEDATSAEPDLEAALAEDDTDAAVEAADEGEAEVAELKEEVVAEDAASADADAAADDTQKPTRKTRRTNVRSGTDAGKD